MQYIAPLTFDEQRLQSTTANTDVLNSQMDLLNDSITPYEVRRARLSLKLRKASLGMEAEHLHLLECFGIDVGLGMIFNAFWDAEYIPENCRTAKIIPLFKGGGKDASSPLSYRPISICDVLAKLYDSIITYRLKRLLECKIDERQYGGRSGLGCNLQLIRIAEYLNEARCAERGDTGKPDFYVVFLLCDMAKAFDRSARWLLLKMLLDHGISGRLLNAVAAFLCDRKQYVTVDGKDSTTSATYNGFPQGGIISLFAFLLYVNSLPGELHNAISSLYVDDLAGIYCATKPLHVLKKLLEDFRRLKPWSVRHQQIFAPAKFHLVNIGRTGRKLPKYAQARAIFDDVAVQWSQKIKFLGSTWDSNLRFTHDIREIMKKIRRSSFKIWMNSKERSGCSVGFLMRSFQEHAQSHLLHGSSVWIFVLFPQIRLEVGAASPYTDAWNQLKSQLCDILRKICHARDKTSHLAILVRLGLLPAHYFIASHAMTNYFTITNTRNAPANKKQCESFRDSGAWNNSLFYAGAESNIQYFQKWADVPLMECNNRKSFRKALERAMFAELTEAWEISPVARHTHNLIPLWKPRKHALTHDSTTSERYYDVHLPIMTHGHLAISELFNTL